MEPERVSHYELRNRLGRGGMGEVYEAFDLKARRRVAIKFVAPELASDPAAFARFETEAVSAAAMNHPHIATLHQFEPEGDRPFIVMELIAGPSLKTRLESGPLAPAEAVAIGRDVAAALAYAHRRGIVHRDIKPENLMFDEEGRIKVMDFGLARALLASRLTMTGSSLGTPSYMSPESVRQGSGGPESDVFALGLVLTEMMTGRQVFQAESPLAVMFAIANVDAPPLRSQRPDAPEALERLVSRMLAKAPAERPDAATVARELAELSGTRLPEPSGLQDLVAAAPPAPRAAATTLATGTIGTAETPGAGTSATAATPPPAGARGGRRRAIGIALAAIVVGGGVALWMSMGSATRNARRQEAVLLNNQAFAEMQRGDLNRARLLVERALERDPGYGQAMFNRARILHFRGELDSAASLYDAVARAHPRDDGLLAAVYFNLGDLDLTAGAAEQAGEHLAESFRRDSSRWEVYSNLGYAWIEAQRPREALALLERGIARFPGAASLYKNAGLALVAMDREPEAMLQVERALARDSRLASARALRARLRARAGDLEGARADWSFYLASEPARDSKDFAAAAREMLERKVVREVPAAP